MCVSCLNRLGIQFTHRIPKKGKNDYEKKDEQMLSDVGWLEKGDV